jgi:hypothetical protein
MIQIRPFQEKDIEGGERRSQLGHPWKVPLLSGQWKVLLLGGQWKEKEQHLFYLFPFSPLQILLKPSSPPHIHCQFDFD